MFDFYLRMLVVYSRIPSVPPPAPALYKSLFQSRDVPLVFMALLVCDFTSRFVGKCSSRRLERVTQPQSNIKLSFKPVPGLSYTARATQM